MKMQMWKGDKMQKIKIVGKHYLEIKKDRQYIVLIRENGNKYPPKNLIATDEELVFAVMLNEKQYKKLESDKEKFIFEGELLRNKLHEDADFSFVCYHVGDVENKKEVEKVSEINEEIKTNGNNREKTQTKIMEVKDEIFTKNINSIKILPMFKMPKQEKIDEKIEIIRGENGVNSKPVVISGKNILVEGYTTYLALKHLGINDVKCKQVVVQKKIKKEN